MPLTDDERELLIACRLGKADMVRAQLARGISPNVTDVHGRSAISKAAIAGHRDIIRMLIDAGADTSEVGQTEIVREMLSPGSTAPSRMEIPEDLNYYELINEANSGIICDGFDNLLLGPSYSDIVFLANALHGVGAIRCAEAVQAVIALVEEGGLVEGGFRPERARLHLNANRQRLHQHWEQYCAASAEENPVARAEQFMLGDFHE